MKIRRNKNPSINKIMYSISFLILFVGFFMNCRHFLLVAAIALLITSILDIIFE